MPSALDLLATTEQAGGMYGAQHIPHRPWYEDLQGLLMVLPLILLLAAMIGYLTFQDKLMKKIPLKIRPRKREEKHCILATLISLFSFFVYCTGNSCSSYFRNFSYNLFRLNFYDALFEYHPAFGWLILLPMPFIIGAISWDNTYGKLLKWLEKSGNNDG
ncbi:MAG: hypothetical protein IT560_03540 [Alphaproteobacteria bacterium]|nr:hypothetical protein [Alphaproteobacteria bacterium]